MKVQIHTNIQQGSADWYKLRLGKITASSFHKLLGTKAAREKYLCDKASEIITGCRSDGEEYTNIHIQRGNGWEEEARAGYILKTSTNVQEVSFIQLNEYVGCSPDGLIADDGMLEIKVPDSNNFLKMILEINQKGIEAISPEHYAQMQLNLYISGRKWCDYVLYNHKHAAIGKGLFIRRVQREEAYSDTIKTALYEGIKQINEYIEQYYNIMGNKNE